MYCSHCGKQIQPDTKFCPNCGKSILSHTTGPQDIPVPAFGPASVGIRFVNYILDRIFIFIFVVLVSFLGSFVLKEDALEIISILVFFIGYDLFFEGIWQKTPAKWITKTKVVMNDGSKPNLLHILGRTLARHIPFEPFSFIAGPIGWHDSLSKTMVVPSNYSAEQVKQINPKLASASKVSTPIIIAVCFFVGIALIGLLSSVVLLALNSARAKSRDAKRLADVRQMASALELYFNDMNSYPPSLPILTPSYIGTIPTEPTPPDGTCTPEQNSYNYKFISGDNYILTFCLGTQTSGYSAGINNLTQAGIESGYKEPFDPSKFRATPATQPTNTGKDCPHVKNAFLASDNECYCKIGYTINDDSTSCIQQ